MKLEIYEFIELFIQNNWKDITEGTNAVAAFIAPNSNSHYIYFRKDDLIQIFKGSGGDAIFVIENNKLVFKGKSFRWLRPEEFLPDFLQGYYET